MEVVSETPASESGVFSSRLSGSGWLALVGGGEFSFDETLLADRAWLAKAPPGPVGFIPAASGSTDYGEHFADYLAATFEREVETIPIFRLKDARRMRNSERIAECAAVYLGGGISDQLLEALAGTPAADALLAKIAAGGVVAGIAAAAQAAGSAVRSLTGAKVLDGLGWLPETAIDTNFDPAHDRRLRQLLAQPGTRFGLGLPAGSAVLLGPDGAVETVGLAFTLGDADDDLTVIGQE
jgi:cyanophycinase-like exopeptidase